jgi:hypothetical protein
MIPDCGSIQNVRQCSREHPGFPGQPEFSERRERDALMQNSKIFRRDLF